MIAIIDYGLGNIGSIKNMLKHVGASDVIFAQNEDDIFSADKLILPGVGKFDAGMKKLNESGLRESLDTQVIKNKKPILGICLGMQMLGLRSEEGNEEGLGYIDFECKIIDSENGKIKVPHMGWDYVSVLKDNNLLKDTVEKKRFYFVHSYYAVCKNTDDIWMTCDYGMPITAAVHKENIYGTQFHPEKSHKFGMELFEKYVRL